MTIRREYHHERRQGRPARRLRRRIALICGPACLACAIAATTGGQAASAIPARPDPATVARGQGAVNLTKLYWLFYKEDIERINKFDPGVVQVMASGGHTYALTRTKYGPRFPPGVIPVENFFSAASLAAAIRSRDVIPQVKVVAEDPEDWRSTPIDERLTPIKYMKDFASTAEGHGLLPILVPARDLLRVKKAACTATPAQTISQAYVACGLPAAAAKARIFVIQAAAVETNLPALRQLVQQGASEARKANPNVNVLATLSAAPNGTAVSLQALISAATTVLPYVNGFELNSEPHNDHELVSFLEALRRG